MYFIHNPKKLITNNFFLFLIPTSAVFLTMLGLTILGWRNADQSLIAERQSIIDNVVTETRNDITDKLEAYRLVLLGASGLFASTDNVTTDEWAKFVQNFEIEKNYPGVAGIGYMIVADRNNLPKLELNLRASGHKNAKIHPETETKQYAITSLFIPKHENGIGYNMFSDPARSIALNEAKNTGIATLSKKIIYSKKEMPFSGVGFSMYNPVFNKQNEISNSGVQKQIKGYVFTPFLAGQFFPKALQNSSKQTHAIKIYVDSINLDNLLYQSNNFASLDDSNSIKETQMIKVFNQKWVIDYRFSPDVIAKATRNRPAGALISGLMLSILLSGFVLTLLITRSKTLAHSKQKELSSAKDELLSLASHQLRTPATSVKQYVGMLIEGFAGKLSTQQKNLLEKAYESNERQLHIINEILHVAKIDAKGIVLTPRQLDLSKLLRNLTQELSVTAKKSNQRLRLIMPKKPTHIEADEHSLRMAIENLISNALKYSEEDTTTTVKLEVKDNEVCIVIKDKGVGIAPADLPQLFQRFSRIPNELSRQTSGSGIGLYLSQQLIKLHNGDIDVVSEKDKGSSFIVTLPRKYAPLPKD